MQDHDFLLPVRGAVSMQQAKKRPVLNEFEFLNYHRYGSQARLLSDEDLKRSFQPLTPLSHARRRQSKRPVGKWQ